MFIDCVSVYSSWHCFEVKSEKKGSFSFHVNLHFNFLSLSMKLHAHLTLWITSLCAAVAPHGLDVDCVSFSCSVDCCFKVLLRAWLFFGFVVVFYLSPSVLVLPPSMDQWWPRQWSGLPNTAYFILIGLAHRHFLWSLSGSEQVKIYIYIHTVNKLPTFIPLEVRQYLCKGMVWKMYLYRILWLCVNISIHWKNWSS